MSLIKKDWSAYLSTHLTAEEKQLSDTVDAQLERMLTQGVVPALMALRQADFAAANQILLTTLRPEAGTLAGTLEQLLELQSAIGPLANASPTERAGRGGAGGMCLVSRGVPRPMRLASRCFRRLSRRCSSSRVARQSIQR